MIRTSLLTLSLAAAMAAAPPVSAQAQADDSPGGWAFEAGAGTDNRSKAASKSGNDGYVFGAATWESGDGRFYAGPAVETIQAGGSHVEAELVAGYRPEAWGYVFDLSVAYKNRLEAEPGYDEDGWELTADVSRAVGPAEARLQIQYSPDAPGSTDAFVWVEAQAAWAFSQQLEGSIAIGRREQSGAPDYTGWNAGVTYALTDALALDLRYHDTDAAEFGEQYRDALVLEAAYAF